MHTSNASHCNIMTWLKRTWICLEVDIKEWNFSFLQKISILQKQNSHPSIIPKGGGGMKKMKKKSHRFLYDKCELGKDIVVFRFIIEYSSLIDFGP